ncbi:hypothetical protein ACHAXR_010113 [Thalassiosira sp. AJA248-18]
MIVPRPLHSIHLLTFLSKRSSESLAQAGLNFRMKRALSAMSSSHDDGSLGCDNKNGRIWTHRPFQITPTTPSSSSSTSVKPKITNCPLPKTTPHSAPVDKLHSLVSSSPSPDKYLEQIHQSKVEFYETQFQSRVTKEEWPRIDRRTIQSPCGLGEVDATIYFPEKEKVIHDDTSSKLQGICLHVHGGGWLWGDSYHQVAHRCLEMAQSLNVAVVSVEYSLFCQVNRHSENNKSNAFDPVNDVSVAIDWIESNGVRELNAYPSFVGSGESSGAHLLLLAMLNRRDRDEVALHPPVPLPTMNSSPTSQSTNAASSSWSTSSWKCLNLVYGVYDISGTPSIRADGDSSSPLCGNDLLFLYDLYYSKVQESMKSTGDGSNSAQKSNPSLDRQHPSLSPLYANLSHLPPALISTGTADPLLDDSLFMANKYSSYGNHVELAIYEGGEHGIGHFGVQEDEEMGVRARGHTLDFMKEYL